MGDAAVVVGTGGVRRAAALAGRLRSARLAGVDDVVPADSSVGVLVDPDVADPEAVGDEALRLLGSVPSEGALAAAGSGGRLHEVPVVFDGEDLALVATQLGKSPGAVVAELCGAVLEVGFLGFLPGFAYLLRLPSDLAALARLPRPRRQVEAGSVALGGGYAGIYPSASPGGWLLVGRTAFGLFDPDTPPYAVLEPGDGVRFVPAGDAEEAEGAGRDADEAPGEPSRTGGGRPPLRTDHRRALEVLSAGGVGTVQDRGRLGAAHLGVPRAGAFDQRLAERANLAVGNVASAGVLELAGTGFRARCRGDLAVVLAAGGGVTLALDGRALPEGAVAHAPDGSTLELLLTRPPPGGAGPAAGGAPGARAYLAVAGGVTGPVHFGSCSSDLVSGIPPGPLVAGDELAVGEPGRPRGRLALGPGRSGTARLRVLAAAGAAAPLSGTVWLVDRASDRTGVRLARLEEGGAGRPAGDGGAPRRRHPSQAMVTGAVQLPPDGLPIVLGPDHGTVGGYEVACTVITADLPVLAQLAPGDEVEIVAVTREEAADARRAAAEATRRAASGWLPASPG